MRQLVFVFKESEKKQHMGRVSNVDSSQNYTRVCMSFCKKRDILWGQKKKMLKPAANPYSFDRNEDRGEPNMAHSVLCFGAAGEEAMRRDATESG